MSMIRTMKDSVKVGGQEIPGLSDLRAVETVRTGGRRNGQASFEADLQTLARSGFDMRLLQVFHQKTMRPHLIAAVRQEAHRIRVRRMQLALQGLTAGSQNVYQGKGVLS